MRISGEGVATTDQTVTEPARSGWRSATIDPVAPASAAGLAGCVHRLLNLARSALPGGERYGAAWLSAQGCPGAAAAR